MSIANTTIESEELLSNCSGINWGLKCRHCLNYLGCHFSSLAKWKILH